MECPVATAEDILLAKLEWYGRWGEISEWQWSDVGGIMATNPTLDIGYVEEWTNRLGVLPLYRRAMLEAGRG